MPLLLTYQKRPVDNHKRDGKLIAVTFVSPVLGAPRERIVVSQADWDQHSREEFYKDRDAMPDKRELARKFAPTVS